MLKKKLVIGAAVMVGTLLTSAPNAQAGGWLLWLHVNRVHNHYASMGRHGSHGCWGSGRLLGRLGPRREGPGILAHLRARRHARLHARGHHAGHWGHGHASHGSFGSHGSWGSHGSHGSWGWGGDVVLGSPVDGGVFGPAIEGPVIEGPAIEGAAPQVVPGGELVDPPAPAKEAGKIRFDLEVPADAAIFINGKPTNATGTMRKYVSRGLKPDTSYRYTIRAEVIRDGRLLTRSERLELRAGQRERLAFDFAVDPSRATTLVLNVPETAKVILAGTDTHSSGAQREFVTTLPKESKWADYPVRVEFERDGKTLVEELNVTLRSGDRQELDFPFHAAKVARSK